MQIRKLRPRDGDHLGGGVELHGAGAERNHDAVEGQVTIGEPAHVAQDFSLGAILAEDRMVEKRAPALEAWRNRRSGLDLRKRRRFPEASPDGFDQSGRCGFIEADPDPLPRLLLQGEPMRRKLKPAATAAS